MVYGVEGGEGGELEEGEVAGNDVADASLFDKSDGREFGRCGGAADECGGGGDIVLDGEFDQRGHGFEGVDSWGLCGGGFVCAEEEGIDLCSVSWGDGGGGAGLPDDRVGGVGAWLFR